MADTNEMTREQKLAAGKKKLKKFQQKKRNTSVVEEEETSTNISSNIYVEEQNAAEVENGEDRGHYSGNLGNSENKNSNIVDSIYVNGAIDKIRFSDKSIATKCDSSVNFLKEELNQYPSINANSESKHNFTLEKNDVSLPISIVQETYLTVLEKEEPEILPDSTILNSDISTSEISDVVNVVKYDCDPVETSSTCSQNFIASSVTQKASAESEIHSPSESLRQISLQLHGLINTELSEPAGDNSHIISDLEKRNSELAVLLQQETVKSNQLSLCYEEMVNKNHALENELKTKNEEIIASNESHNEIQILKEQLQMHIKTISILVAEKSQLQASVASLTSSLNTKNDGFAQLEAKLKSIKQQLVESEKYGKDLTGKEQSLRIEKEALFTEIDSLSQKLVTASKDIDELHISKNELVERLSSSMSENEHLSNELHKVVNKLSMTEVHVQQLRSNASINDYHSKIEELKSCLQEHKTQIDSLQESLMKNQLEKTELSSRYKTYTDQLTAQLEQSNKELQEVSNEVSEIKQVKKTLEVELAALNKTNEEFNKQKYDIEKKELSEKLLIMKEEKGKLQTEFNTLNSNNKQLSLLLEEQNQRLEELEFAAEKTNAESVDTTQLLSSMQSDKIAASRALTQNKMLKEQLEELQNGFIMMSNKKLELTERLEKEVQHKRHLQLQISEINNKLKLTEEKLSERSNDCNSLNLELQRLSYANISVGDNHATKANHSCSEAECHGKVFPAGVDCKEVGTNTSSNTCTEEVSCEHSEKLSSDAIENSSKNLNSAYKALEQRFSRSMNDVAELSDEKQKLEHVVQQLQVETETIGDYITIYQFQRGIMKQQAVELQQELNCLRKERNEINKKLLILQELVMSLVKTESNAKIIANVNNILNFGKYELDADAPSENQSHESMAVKNPDADATMNDPQKSNIKATTVAQIMNLISEMEQSQQLDFGSIHKFHPCPLCSGKLITV